ncbi:MAG: HRDC domain-containing protein [Verrucomicrobiota bacterium]
MRMAFFWIPAADSAEASRALNTFLAGHSISKIERHYDPAEHGWSICIDYLEASAAAPEPASNRSNRIDYREVLEPAVFEVFASLRNWRKAQAETQKVPVYNVASNEQLAAIAKAMPSSLSALAQMPGFGKGRIEKYGESLLDVLAQETIRKGVSVEEGTS